MKKLLILFLCLLLLCSCGKKDVPVGSMPADTALEFWICEDVHAEDCAIWDHPEVFGWFGAREFLGTGYEISPLTGLAPEESVSYLVTAWPDYADGGSFVTTITVTDPAVQVFGLTVRSSAEEFARVMRENGFTQMPDTPETVQVWVHPSGTYRVSRTASKLTISAPISNRDNIVF